MQSLFEFVCYTMRFMILLKISQYEYGKWTYRTIIDMITALAYQLYLGQ